MILILFCQHLRLTFYQAKCDTTPKLRVSQVYIKCILRYMYIFTRFVFLNGYEFTNYELSWQWTLTDEVIETSCWGALLTCIIEANQLLSINLSVYGVGGCSYTHHAWNTGWVESHPGPPSETTDRPPFCRLSLPGIIHSGGSLSVISSLYHKISFTNSVTHFLFGLERN